MRISRPVPRLLGVGGALSLVVAASVLGAGTAGAATPAPPSVSPTPFVAADPKAVPAQSLPDDIVTLGADVYVAYQNGVGPKGEPSTTTGNTKSTLVRYSSGKATESWTVVGRIDGMGSDPAHNRIIVTTNEDAYSALYTMTPGSPGVVPFTYSPDPGPAAGGTDSVSVGPDGTIYVAHSALDTKADPATPAVYTATLDQKTHVATLKPFLAANATATDVVTGKSGSIGVSDPDSNKFFPASDPVFGNSLVQLSGSDSKLVIVSDPGTPKQAVKSLTLKLADGTPLAGADDFVEVNGAGTLYVNDQSKGTTSTIDTAKVTPGTIFLANKGQLNVVDPATGVVTPLAGSFGAVKGLTFVPAGHHGAGDNTNDNGNR